MVTNRACGECSVCCFVAEVKEEVVTKSACSMCPFADHGCKLFGKAERPTVCNTFQCAWLRGYGSEKDRPDMSGAMVSVNTMNGGSWIMVMNLNPAAHLGSAKDIIIDIASKIDLPVIVTESHNLKAGMGDYVIIKKSLEHRSSKIKGEFVEKFTDTMNIYKLLISPPPKSQGLMSKD